LVTVHRLRTSQGVKPPQPQQLWRYALIEEMKEEEYGFRRFGIRKPQLIHNGSIVGTHGHSSDTDYTAYVQAMNTATIDIETLAEFLGRHRRIAVLTGSVWRLAFPPTGMNMAIASIVSRSNTRSFWQTQPSGNAIGHGRFVAGLR
jgi:hypothetical protein